MQSNLGNTPDVYLPLIILPIQFNFFLQQQKGKKHFKYKFTRLDWNTENDFFP